MRAIRLLLPLFLVLSACTAESDGVPTDTSTTAPRDDSMLVEVTGFLFKPRELTLELGTTLTFANLDAIRHTVTDGTPDSPGDRFDLDLDGAGASGDIVFDRPGTYLYFCSVHTHMTGSVEVVGQ